MKKPNTEKMRKIARAIDDLLNNEKAEPEEAQTVLLLCLIADMKACGLERANACELFAKLWDRMA